MTGASAGAGRGPSSPAFRLCGEDGRAEWLRFYDLVEAQVEALAADRAHLGAARGEGEEAIPPADRLAELQEGDLEDVSACRGLLSLRNTESKQVQDRLELGENTGDHEHIAKALRANLRKLKGAFETLLSKKDKDVYSVKDVLLNQFRTMQKDNTLFENNKLEAAQATEEAKKHQQNVQVLHVAAENKDDEIGRLQAETLVAQQKLHEMDSLLKEKDESIEKLHAENIGVLAVKDFLWSQFQIKEQELLDYAMLLKNKEVAAAEVTEEAKKHQQNVQALHVAAQNKDDEIGRLQAEALLAQQKLHEMDSLLKEKDESIEKLRAENIGVLAVKDFLWSQSQIKEQELRDYAMLLKNKEVPAAQATKAAQKLVKENCMMEAEVVDYGNKLLILEDKLKETHFLAKEKDDEIQELKNRQHEITSLKRKCASSLSNETPSSSGDFTASKLPPLKINPEAQAKRRKTGGSTAAPTVQEPEHAKLDSPAPVEARKNASADAPQPSETTDNDMAIPEPNPSTATDNTTPPEVVVTGTGYHPSEPHVLTKHTSKAGTCSPDKFEFEFSVPEKLMADELHAGYLNCLFTSRNMESKLVGMMKKKYEEALEAAESNLTGLRENVASQQAATAEAEEKWQVAVEELAKLQADFTAFKKTVESKEAALTKRANDADQRLKLALEELQTLKRHISRMTCYL